MLQNRDALERWDREHFFRPTPGVGVCAVHRVAAEERP